MKTKELKNREGIPKSTMMLFTSILLVMLTLAQVGCSSKDDEIVSYTVMFDADGGAPTPASQHVEAGKTVTAPSANPTKTGYVFLFWHSEGASTAYNFNTPVSKNITLYAKWQAEATAEYWQVAWELNEGTWTAGDNHATKVIKGGTLIEPIAPTKAGKILDGWYKEATLTNKVSFPYDVSAITANITLYAKWSDPTAEYWQITWELNGGAWPPTADNHVTKIEKGSKLAEPAAPTKAGNTFDGWYKEAAFTNKVTFPHAITADTKLYAKWVIDGSTEKDPDGYTMFESIAALKLWMGFQTSNTTERAYKVGLKNVNLDSGTNWGDLGAALNLPEVHRYVDLNLQNCTGQTIPDGRQTSSSSGSGVTITTYGAFVGCKLTAITFPKSLKTVGKYAFYECLYLQDIVWNESLATINESAFLGCEQLTSITFRGGITSIGKRAFDECSHLASVTFPEGLKSIGDLAFHSNYDLSDITIPESLTSLGTSCFWGSGLKSVIIKAKLKEIPRGTFGYTKLTSVVLPEGIEVIGKDAFYNCSLEKVDFLPESVKIIEESAFTHAVFGKIRTVILPANVESIGFSAFYLQPINTIISYATTPPTLEVKAISATVRDIKVPASSVEAYKTAWSAFADKIVANTN